MDERPIIIWNLWTDVDRLILKFFAHSVERRTGNYKQRWVAPVSVSSTDAEDPGAVISNENEKNLPWRFCGFKYCEENPISKVYKLQYTLKVRNLVSWCLF